MGQLYLYQTSEVKSSIWRRMNAIITWLPFLNRCGQIKDYDINNDMDVWCLHCCSFFGNENLIAFKVPPVVWSYKHYCTRWIHGSMQWKSHHGFALCCRHANLSLSSSMISVHNSCGFSFCLFCLPFTNYQGSFLMMLLYNLIQILGIKKVEEMLMF